jgi:hypothetical protein
MSDSITRMDWGFATVQDLVDILLIPITVALAATLWPSFLARKRRKNFEQLIRRELQEARPYVAGLKKKELKEQLPRTDSPYLDSKVKWHQHLDRDFLHEAIIQHPVDNADFVLSLNPNLSYPLSQMWTEFRKAEQETELGKDPDPNHAEQFSWYLEETARALGKRWQRKLLEDVWDPWLRIIKSKHPEALKDMHIARGELPKRL